MKIKDNFLGLEEFNKIQKLIMGMNFTWFYNDRIVFEGDDKFQFIHNFYNNYTPMSPFIDKLNPILEIINPLSIVRMKANLLTRTSNIVENIFHVDISSVSEEKLKQMTTSIFYVNTNNGYTKFEDGTIVESVANRMITFPTNIKHCGTSCTNERTRIVINFNYFKLT